MMTRLRRIFAACLAAACLVGGLRAAAFAQSSENTGIIQITVKSADSQALLSNARVFLLGPSVASALTTRSGIVKYTDVASGIYRVRVNKPGFRNSTSSAFELLGNKEVDVDVMLGSNESVQTASSDGSERRHEDHRPRHRARDRVDARRRRKQRGAPHLRFAGRRA